MHRKKIAVLLLTTGKAANELNVLFCIPLVMPVASGIGAQILWKA